MFRDGKTGVFDKTGGKPARPEDLVRLAEQEAVENYGSILPNPKTILFSPLCCLSPHPFPYSGCGIYWGRIWKRSIYEMYQEFLTEQAARGYGVDVREGEYDVYDLAALPDDWFHRVSGKLPMV